MAVPPPRYRMRLKCIDIPIDETGQVSGLRLHLLISEKVPERGDDVSRFGSKAFDAIIIPRQPRNDFDC